MGKKVAVLAVNPVNGLGLFQYLEGFYENKIDYKVFSVFDSVDIKTNSGISIRVDDVIENLYGHASEYDAVVFSCGDAVPVFAQNADKHYNQLLFKVIKEFADMGKLIIGHCGAGVFFDGAEIDKGRRIACHPYVKDAIKNGVYTSEPYAIDGNLYTAAEENQLHLMMPEVIKALS